MKKICVTVKDEDTLIEELNEEQLENIEAGGCFVCFSCFTWKRCVGFKTGLNMCPQKFACGYVTA